MEDDSFREAPQFRWRAFSGFGRWFRDNLRLVQLGYEAQLLIKTKLDERRSPQPAPALPGPPAANDNAKPPSSEISVENMVYLKPDATWNEAWRVTEGLMDEIHREVNEKGARFMLVIGSNPIQVHPDPAVRQRFQAYVGMDDLFYPNRRLEQLANREAIDFFDLAQPLQRYADEKKVYLHGFGKEIGNGHWNVDGHRQAADLIAQKMCSEVPPKF